MQRLLSRHHGSEYDSLLVINKDEIIPYITKAIQEQDEKITNLEKENKILKVTMEELLKRIEKLEDRGDL